MTILRTKAEYISTQKRIQSCRDTLKYLTNTTLHFCFRQVFFLFYAIWSSGGDRVQKPFERPLSRVCYLPEVYLDLLFLDCGAHCNMAFVIAILLSQTVPHAFPRKRNCAFPGGSIQSRSMKFSSNPSYFTIFSTFALL